MQKTLSALRWSSSQSTSHSQVRGTIPKIRIWMDETPEEICKLNFVWNEVQHWTRIYSRQHVSQCMIVFWCSVLCLRVMAGTRCSIKLPNSFHDQNDQSVMLFFQYVDFFQKGILKSLRVRVPLQKLVHFPSPFATQIWNFKIWPAQQGLLLTFMLYDCLTQPVSFRNSI